MRPVLGFAYGFTAKTSSSRSLFPPEVQELALPWYRNCARTACRLPEGSAQVAVMVRAPEPAGVNVPISVQLGLLALAATSRGAKAKVLRYAH